MLPQTGARVIDGNLTYQRERIRRQIAAAKNCDRSGVTHYDEEVPCGLQCRHASRPTAIKNRTRSIGNTIVISVGETDYFAVRVPIVSTFIDSHQQRAV